MRILCFVFLVAIPSMVFAQAERDTILNHCPVFITDTVSSNNYFLEFQPATLKVYRVRGDLTIQVQQKDQFFTLFFKEKKLKEGKYKIVDSEADDREVMVKYSFRSGNSASSVSVTKGTVETAYNKEKSVWHVKVNGLLSNLAAHTVSYYRARAEFYLP